MRSPLVAWSRAASWPRRGGWPLPLCIGVAALLIGCRLLVLIFTVFEHAYLGSYWFVPGAHVSAAYWASVRFAFQATVLVSVGVGLAAALVAAEIARAVHR